MKRLTFALAAVVALSGCAVTSLAEHGQTCELVRIAMIETDELAPAWYLEAGDFRETQCGDTVGRARGELMACFAEQRNGYRSKDVNCLDLPPDDRGK